MPLNLGACQRWCMGPAFLAMAVLQCARLSPTAAAVVLSLGALMWGLRVGAFPFLSSRIQELRFVFLGMAVVLAPLGGVVAFTAIVLFFLWLERKELGTGWFGPALPLLILALGWVGVELWTEQTVQSALYVLRGDGTIPTLRQVESFLAWYQGNSTAPIRALDWVARLMMILGIAAALAGYPRKFEALCSGLVGGLLAALPVVGWQILLLFRGEALSTTFQLQQKFWDTLQRIPGTFSDPNAFGVAMLLMLPILWEYARRLTPPWATLTRAVVVTSLGLVAFSGSRVGALGLLIVVAGAMLYRPRLAVVAALVAVVLIAALNLVPSARQFATAPSMPESVRRVADGVVFSNASHTFFSRAVFLQISARLLAANPWLGIGLERYRDYVVQLSTGTEGVVPLWTDNANNFYLGLAVELGLFGFLCFIAVLSGFRLCESAPSLLRWTLGAFAVALIFGPHIEFPEVAVLLGVLLAVTVEPRVARDFSAPIPGAATVNHRGWAVAVAIVLLPAIFLKGSFGQHGFHPWERDGARFFRWSGIRAQGWVACAPGAATTALYLRSSRPPGVAVLPAVTVSTGGVQSQVVSLQGGAISKVELPCPGESREVFLQYSIAVQHPYFGWRKDVAGDVRLLGVQVVSRDPGATVPF